MRTTLLRVSRRGFAAATAIGFSGLAHAHPGHGELAVSHWHAGDAVLWTLGLAVGVVAWWLLRRK